MAQVVDTNALLDEGLITSEQARIIVERARRTMVNLAVNTVLTSGVIAAALGFVLWLQDALAVSVLGSVLAALGAAVLVRGTQSLRMFGNAAALIGAGMLFFGGAVEGIERFHLSGAYALTAVGGALGLGLALAFLRTPERLRFATGAVLLMAVALHLFALHWILHETDASAVAVAFALLYASVLTALAGWHIDVRVVTAVAIVPFAQMLDAGTGYWHAVYAFWSPESTLTILQMSMVAASGLLLAPKLGARVARHGGILAIMALIVGNLAALVGSLWGDRIGEHAFTGGPYRKDFADSQSYYDALSTWRDGLIHIPAEVYSVVWFLALAAVLIWAAFTARRGVFNATLTFAGIHGYTQMFEALDSAPMAFAIGGVAAVPLAWGIWRTDHYLAQRAGA